MYSTDDTAPGPEPEPETKIAPNDSNPSTPYYKSFDLLPDKIVSVELDIPVGHVTADEIDKDIVHCFVLKHEYFSAELTTNGSTLKQLRIYESDPQLREHKNEVLLVIIYHAKITQEVACRYKDDKNVVFIGCTFDQCIDVSDWVIGLNYRMFISCNGLHIYGDGTLEWSDLVGSVDGLVINPPSTISNVNFYFCDMVGVLSRRVRYRAIGVAICAFDVAILYDDDICYHIGMFVENEAIIGKGIVIGDYIGCKRCGNATPHNIGSEQYPEYTYACAECAETCIEVSLATYLLCDNNLDILSLVMPFWS